MDDQTKQLLDSPNPIDRKKAIKIIAQTKDETALPYLAALYKTESDPEIKELAIQAGRYIRKQQESPKWEGKAPRETTESAEKPKHERVEVSEANEKKSHGLMDRAMNFIGGREPDAEKQAQDLVRKAYALNPNIRFDPYYKGIVGQAFSMNADDVMDMLDKGVGMGDEKPKRKRGDAQTGATWGDAMGAYALYAIVIGGFFVVSIVLSLMFLRPQLQSYLELNAANSEFSSQYSMEGMENPIPTSEAIAQVLSILTGASVVIAIVYGVFIAIFSVIFLFIYHVSLHVVAKLFLGGEGTLPSLIYKTTVFLTITSVISAILSGASTYISFSQFASFDMTTVDSFEALEQMSNQANSLSSISMILSLASLGFSIFILYRMCQLIGQVYQFGTGRGCATILINSIMWMVLICGFSYMLVQAFASTYMSSLNMFLTVTPR